MKPRVSKPSSDKSRLQTPHKRVSRTCDRCRLKKSKCNGANPCSRCRADNSICVYGMLKRVHEKVYPRRYIEMLENQQLWLIQGLRKLYHCVTSGEGWPGDSLGYDPGGRPLTQSLLACLSAIDLSKNEYFEESVETLQKVLWSSDLHNFGVEDIPLPDHHLSFFPNTYAPQTASSPLPALSKPSPELQAEGELLLGTEEYKFPPTQDFVEVTNQAASLAQWQVLWDS